MSRSTSRRIILGCLVILAMLALMACATAAHANSTLHVSCTHPTAPVPDYIIWPQASCVIATGVGLIGQVANEQGMSCIAQSISGVHSAGVNYMSCTKSYVDNVSTVGVGHFYVNALAMPSDANTPGFYLRVSHPTAINGGCISATIGGVASFQCPKQNLQNCAYGNLSYACSYSVRREPEMSELVQMVQMAWIGGCLITGLLFGWRVVQRGSSQ